MRRIENTSQFKKDFKREAKGLHRKPNGRVLQLVRLGSHSKLGL